MCMKMRKKVNVIGGLPVKKILNSALLPCNSYGNMCVCPDIVGKLKLSGIQKFQPSKDNTEQSKYAQCS